MRNIRCLLLLCFMILAGCSSPQGVPRHTLPAHCEIYDMRQAACIDRAELVRRLKPSRVPENQSEK